MVDTTAPTDRESNIYGDALALPVRERRAYLDRACAEDQALRKRVEELLFVCEEAGAFFEGLERETQPVRAAAFEGVGKWIGRYLLLEQIGEGGCGVVYRAQQENPVQRQVALKVIKLGMDTKQVVARFEAERQALALMDHRHIARVLDAGATETGRPYFVMELVRGTKITDYCDQRQQSIGERLDLFIQSCRAIQHAHQKGVIHRDIKPSNILVTLQDGVAFPKVIDFGIAKATQGRLTNQTLHTAVEQFVGTPAYMSPEQAEFGGIDIDTRSDIYSLGVLLYELLTSRMPFDSSALLDQGLDVLLRTIREEEPVRPSNCLQGLASERLAMVARNRRLEPVRVVATIRGDLDWIVMKALEKDRARRYETVDALILDIERHLANEPVAARPPSWLDRSRKVIRRNRLVFAAGSAVLAALVLGLGVSTWLFVREREARRQAVAATVEQERLRIHAEDEALKSRQFAESLEDVLDRLGPAVTSSYNRAELQRILESLTPSKARTQSATFLRMRTYLRGNSGRILDAASDIEQLLQLTPNDSEIWHWRAVTLVSTGEFESYRIHCQKAVEHFKDPGDPLTAERIAKDGLILPNSGVDLDRVDRIIETALRAGPKHSEFGWFQLAKGMAEYRRENFERALKWLGGVKTDRDIYLDAQTALMQAMAAQQASQSAAAIEAFQRASTIMEQQLPHALTGETSACWIDWLIVQALAREARSVLQISPKEDSESRGNGIDEAGIH